MADDDFTPEETPGYKAPAQASLEEMKQKDADDESLNKWKAALLGGGGAGPGDDPRRCVVLKMSMVIAGRGDVDLDLTGDLTKLKEVPFVIKEGCEYRLKITFKVQHEVVCGLKYMHAIYRKGIRFAKDTYMVGSYGPQAEPHVFLKKDAEEAPSGMIARGHYIVKSKFVDDDNNVYCEWEWALDIKKDWA